MVMRGFRGLILPLCLPALLAAGSCAAQTAPAGMPTTIGHTARLAVELGEPQTRGKLTVTSPAFAAGQDIPFENTLYRGNTFPGLAWTKGPAGTRAYAVFVEGTLGAGASVHLTLLDLSAAATSLPAGLTAAPDGAVYGPNVHGPNEAYSGPHAHTAVKREYHYQVLALDTVLRPAPGASLESIEAAIIGHVLASGDLVGLSARDPQAPPDAK
jgi:para-nitrobenzyl esterase